MDCTRFLLLIISLTIYLALPIRAKKLYEQTCSSTEDCNLSLGLSCQNRVCRCAQNGETVYSLSRNRCVGAAGRECLKVNISRNVTEDLCVKNSICRDYEYMHLCACQDGFYQSKDGHCRKIGKFGENCLEEEFSCGDTVSSSVSCIQQKCGCLLGEENQYYNSEENKCISYAGGQCLYHYSQSCTPNSYCGEINENIHGAVSFVVGHKCLCNNGYSYTQSKQCLARYGTNCGVNNPCNYDEHLGCLNGKCQCRNPLNEVYNEQTNQCAILVGSICKHDSGPRCIKNAECLTEKNLKFGNCTCNPGYAVTPLSTCLKDINQKCEPNQCNYFNGLTCINNNNNTNTTCNCIDTFLSYDKVSHSCVSLIGFPCGTVFLLEDDRTSADNKKEITILCEANSVCSKINASNFSKRICKPTTGGKN